MLLGDREDGAWTVVSQYGGTASAWAVAYEGGASFWASSLHTKIPPLLTLLL
jgi:hypothetical protein